MAVDTATANCGKSWPLMPGMKAAGTNTDKSTRVMAMIGAVISPIAFLVASGMVRAGFSSMTRSTFSMTTMAWSTTIPIATTSASSARDERRPELAQEQEDDDRHQHEGDDQRVDDLVDGRGHEHRGIPEHLVFEVVREALLHLVHDLADVCGHVDGIGAGRLEDADRRGRRTVEAAVALLALGAEIGAGDVLDAHDRTVG